MDSDSPMTRLRPTPKKKQQATYLSEGEKLNVVIPKFRTKEEPEVNLPMLKLAFRDLIEHLRAKRVLEYKLHTIAAGEYGRYTADLFYQLKGHNFDAHIDIIDQLKIISVIMFNLKEKKITSVYSKVNWNSESINLCDHLEVEIKEIMELLMPEEEIKQEGDVG